MLLSLVLETETPELVSKWMLEIGVINQTTTCDESV
jgi:hypothetical protein